MKKLWQNEGLEGINDFLHDIEMSKKREEKKRKLEHETLQLNPKRYSSLEQSRIWNRTKKENKYLQEFSIQLNGYKPMHEIQRRVISFADLRYNKYIILSSHSEDVDNYIGKSTYWEKKSVIVKSIHTKHDVKIVFAENKQMLSIVFQYLGYFIVTTKSSFENFLSEIEGNDYETKFIADKIKSNLEKFEVTTPIVDSLSKEIKDNVQIMAEWLKDRSEGL